MNKIFLPVLLQVISLVFTKMLLTSASAIPILSGPSSPEYKCDCFMLYDKSPIRYFSPQISSGLVHSPGYPKGCCSGLHCTYRVEARSGWITRVRVEDFAPACGEDSLLIEERGRTEPNSWEVVERLAGLCHRYCEPVGVDCSQQPGYSAVNKEWDFTGAVRITHSTGPRNVYHGFGLRFERIPITGHPFAFHTMSSAEEEEEGEEVKPVPTNLIHRIGSKLSHLIDYSMLTILLEANIAVTSLLFMAILVWLAMVLVWRRGRNAHRHDDHQKEGKPESKGSCAPPTYPFPAGSASNRQVTE